MVGKTTAGCGVETVGMRECGCEMRGGGGIGWKDGMGGQREREAGEEA